MSRSLSEEMKFLDAVDSEIMCNEEFCPFYMKHMSSPSNPCCEGEYCEEAWGNYCNKYEEDRDVQET